MDNPKLIMTAVAVAAAVLSILIFRRAVSRMDLSPVQRRRTQNVVFYVGALAALLMCAVIWATEIQETALVASGFAVAIVLFNKELILSALGWWLKTMSGAYKIGDRIRVGDMRGDVIDYGVLFTTLMQVDTEADHGMRTGNVVSIPNAMLLTEPVINETRILGFEWKEVHFTLGPKTDWCGAQEWLKTEATKMVGEYQDQLRGQLQLMSERFAFHPIQVEPHVFVKPAKDGGVCLWVRMAMPARSIAVGADRLQRAFLEWDGRET